VARASLEEGIYKLLAALRLMERWVDTTFRSWAVDSFGRVEGLLVVYSVMNVGIQLAYFVR
jgi:hypothetical protein